MSFMSAFHLYGWFRGSRTWLIKFHDSTGAIERPLKTFLSVDIVKKILKILDLYFCIIAFFRRTGGDANKEIVCLALV